MDSFPRPALNTPLAHRDEHSTLRSTERPGSNEARGRRGRDEGVVHMFGRLTAERLNAKYDRLSAPITGRTFERVK